MIDKASLVAKISGSKEAKDYTYAILFLLISSFFGVAVIKPVLGIAVSLNKEAEELRSINQVFEKNITNVVTLQNQMQEIRSTMYLVDMAIPQEPSIQGLMEDIRAKALDLGIVVKTIEVVQNEDAVIVPEEKLVAKPIAMSISIDSDFDQAISLIKIITNQRRLKTIKSISLDKNEGENETGFLTITIELNGYFYTKK